MKHYYKIGEIAKLYHISTDSLRYYEELGILRPARGENGYRMYHIHDLWRLNVIRDLRALGFSMEKIQEYLNHRTLASTEQLLQEELMVIENKIQEWKTLETNIRERLETIREVERQPLGIMEVKKFPARRCHLIQTAYTEDNEMDMLMKQLVNRNQDKLYIIGNNRIGSVISYESIQAKQYCSYTAVFIIDKSGPDILKPGTYLTLSYSGDSRQNERYIPKLLQAAAELGLCPTGPVLELLWSDIHQSEEQTEHITELQLWCEET